MTRPEPFFSTLYGHIKGLDSTDGPLTLPKLYGGQAVPDLHKYHQATRLTRVINWNRHQSTKLWPQLEQSQCSIPLNRAPWCHNSLPRDMKNHPLIVTTTQTCSSLFIGFRLMPPDSLLRPILGTPEFSPGYTDPIFCTLRSSGYFQASHFLINGKWPSASGLMNPDGPFRLDCWRALQLSHFLKSLPPSGNFDQTLTTYETYCSERTMSHTLSAAYQLLITPRDDHQLQCSTRGKGTCSVPSRSVKNKIFFTSHIDPQYVQRHRRPTTKLSRDGTILLQNYKRSSLDHCWRCQGDRGTILHIFWTCPILERFWRTIQHTAQFTERPILADPASFLSRKTYKKSLTRHLLDTAKACIPCTGIPHKLHPSACGSKRWKKKKKWRT